VKILHSTQKEPSSLQDVGESMRMDKKPVFLKRSWAMRVLPRVRRSQSRWFVPTLPLIRLPVQEEEKRYLKSILHLWNIVIAIFINDVKSEKVKL
jgi:hypothetical protein